MSVSRQRVANCYSLVAIAAGATVLISRSIVLVVISTVVAVAFGITGVQLPRLVAAMSIAVVSVGLLLQAFGLMLRKYQLDGRLLLLLLIFIATIVVRISRTVEFRVSPLQTLGVTIFLFLALLMSVRPESADSILVRLASMGEDNGSFLSNFAVSLTNNASVIVPRSGGDASSNAGIIFGVVVAATASMFRVTQSTEAQSLDPAILLLRLYDLLVITAVATSALIPPLVFRRFISWRIYVPTGVATAVAMLSFSLGLVRAGHFTALLLVVWLLLAIYVAMSICSRPTSHLLSLLLVVSAGQIWQPASIASLIALVLFTYWELRRRRAGDNEKKLVLGYLVLTLLSLIFLSDFVRFLLSDSAGQVAGYGGGNSVVDWRLGFLILAVASFGVASDVGVQRAHPLFVVLPLFVATTGVMLLGWLIPPYDPQYGAEKLMFVSVAVCLPLFSGFLLQFLVDRRWSESAFTPALSALGLIAVFLASVNPISYLARVHQQPSQPEWIRGVMAAFDAYPQRTVVCIDTREGGRLDDSYVCSRLMMGIAGMHPPQGNWSNRTSGELPRQSAPSLITAASLCAVASERIADIDQSEWESITIVIADPKRLSSTDDCQRKGWSAEDKADDPRWLIGWLSGVPWSKVPVFSYEGMKVNPSFEYLRNSPYYNQDEVDRLEETLSL